MKLSHLTLLLSITIAVATGTLGCSKKEGQVTQVGGNPLLSEPLLSKLPPSTAAFGVVDVGGQGYQLFRNSPYGGPADAKAALDSLVEQLQSSGADAGLAQMLRRVFDSFVSIGLISADGKYTTEKVLSRVVVFGGPAENQVLPVELGLFAQAAKDCDFTQKSSIIRDSLTQANLVVTAEEIKGATGFSVSAKDVPFKIYVGASKSVLGASLSKAVVEGLFSEKNTDTLATLQAMPAYKRATGTLGKAENPLSFGFASIDRFAPLIEKVAKAGASTQVKLQEIPVEAVALQSSFSKEYVHDAGFAVTPRTESQTKVFNSLQGSSIPASALKLPSDTAFSISLDARSLSKNETIMEQLQQNGGAEAVEQVKNLETVTLAVRNNLSGSPVPDIFLEVDSGKREQLRSSLQTALAGAMSMAGQNASWQTKDISGTQTQFFTTLIGAGVYMSFPEKSRSLLLGTSESAMKDLLATHSGSAKNFIASLSPTLQSQLSSANVALFYVNFKNIADMLDSVKNTLAMFTGGNSELNAALDSANIRTWGVASGGLSYAPGVLTARTIFDASSASK